MATKKQKAAESAAKTPEPVATAVAADGSVDPTLLTAKVTVRGKEYTLCFDLGSLARAEHELRLEGYDVDLSAALPGLTLESVLVLFGASLRRFHPEVKFAEAMKLLTLADVHKVKLAIAEAWRRSLADPEPGEDKKQNPTQPGS